MILVWYEHSQVTIVFADSASAKWTAILAGANVMLRFQYFGGNATNINTRWKRRLRPATLRRLMRRRQHSEWRSVGNSVLSIAERTPTRSHLRRRSGFHCWWVDQTHNCFMRCSSKTHSYRRSLSSLNSSPRKASVLLSNVREPKQARHAGRDSGEVCQILIWIANRISCIELTWPSCSQVCGSKKHRRGILSSRSRS